MIFYEGYSQNSWERNYIWIFLYICIFTGYFYRYVNGLRYDIYDELSLLNMKTVEDAYQVASKVEEKLLRKQDQKIEERI